MNEIKPLNLESKDLVAERIEQMKTLFPEIATEGDGSIDFEKLRLILGEEVDEGDERYAFTWPGKADAIRQAQAPSKATLRPCIDESVDWENTQNLYIEGDNLEVLKLLQNGYHNSVKLIYIDPPYNTGHDFVYKDTFESPIDNYIAQAGLANQSNADTSGRYHSDWCSMIYPRLKLARELLKDEGVIFISIDDNEMDNLKKICDEVFGESNFIARIIHKNNSMKNQSKYIGVSTEYVLVYCKDAGALSAAQPKWRASKKGASDINAMFQKLKSQGLSLEEIRENISEMYARPKYAHLSRWNKVDEKGVFKDADLSRSNGPKDYTIINPNTGRPCPVPSRGWGKSYEELLRLQREDLIWYGDENTAPGQKSYLTEDSESVFDNFVFADTAADKKDIDRLFGAPVFEFPKSLDLLSQLFSLCTCSGDIVLDFFSGSASSAVALMKMNFNDGGARKYIMIQLPEKTAESSAAYKAGYETICEIGKERIRRVGEELFKQRAAENTQLRIGEEPKGVPDVGFRVLKLDESGLIEPEQMTLLDEIVREDRSDQDLIFELMLKWGLELTLPIEKIECAGYSCYSVAADELICCMAEGLTIEALEAIAELEPRRVLMRDKFINDSIKLNAELIFERVKERTQIEVDLRTV